ncbi:Multi-sensor signal transduction histidine kinase [Candidatus Sulfopaludibacter sp. SbA4]|nr:Multi-sensor signal transduction histidine kinase [Candidatus Sulfopaludibacter sp. SbA4]
MERQPIKILVIEDDMIDRALYKRCLQQSEAGAVELAESDSAAAGIEMTHTWQPDCTLLDFNLPDMDGLTAMNRLRGDSGRLPCAVVMLTAYGGEELAVRAMKAGAMDYLQKGHLAADTLSRTVLHAIERFRMQERIEEQRSALERSRQRYQTLLEAIPQMVWTANADGRMEYANRQWFEYTGLDLEDSACMGWDRLLHPEDLERTRTAWDQAAASGSVFEIEHRLRRTTDASYRWHLVRAVPVRTAAGEITNWFGTSTEIEDQKRAEIVARQEHKLEGIGVLAGGVAHDFNNLLVGILGGASCAMETLPPSHPAQKMLQGVMRAGERAAELTRKMLSYAGKGNFQIELTNLGELVCSTCDTIRNSIPNTIRLECHSGCAIPPVVTDPGQLRQVVVELVMNAVEAIDGGSGGISVRSAGVEIDEEAVRRSEFGPAAIPAGQYVTLEVRDTGCGMDEETQARIFDPFFTTRFLGRGLGLAAVYGFARSHGGGVQVESSPGRGTMFRVLLPAAAGAATSPGKV